MNRHARLLIVIAASAAGSLTAALPAMAQDADELEQVVITGTRVANRSALDTVAPVDVVSAESLKNVGVTEVNQALSVALPSFNFPRPGLADGTDTIRPATLRGLAPDQALVLVNSKRRHSASLVNVNGTIGRGAAAVDLNTIPTAIIKSIEVLRDGASAQYGSDAIAGVLNLRLREDRDGGELSLSYGARHTDFETLSGAAPASANWTVPAIAKQSASDGESMTASLWKGFALGENGFLTVALEYKDQQRTERGGYDFRQQYPLVGTAFDPRETTINRFNSWYGEPDMQQATFFANAGNKLANGVELYGWASYQNRDALSAGFFRRALDDRNVLAIYPNGFLPLIAPEVADLSAAGGAKWESGNWSYDAALVYGKNKMAFTIKNTLNRSIGASSKTVFDAGGFDYDQLTLNLSAVRQVQVASFASPLNVAVGLEARRESYSIFAGEPDSYRNGGALLANGTPTASGAQVFPGFRPSNVVDKSRNAVGAYLDLEANLTEKFLGSVAVRAENYSDFGSNLSGKLAGRFDFNDNFALRASAQTGFRAPSQQQQFYTATSTNFINGVPFDITTFPPADPVAVALGAKPLDAEKSVNFSLGAVLRFDRVNITVDAYRINIDNRIVLSENLTAANVRAYLTAQGFIGIGGGRFFINGVDTVTKGVDIVANWPLNTEHAGKFDLTLAANFNNTDVTRTPRTAQLAALNPAPILFDRVNVLTFEEGNPKSKLSVNMNWKLNRWGATLRATRYGDALSPGTTAANDFVLTAKTVIDLEGRVDATDHIRVALGVENLADEYPDPLPASLNTTGNAPFSNYAPFGRGGRYIYGRATFSF